MKRTQFTFYESFFKAVAHIKDGEERACAYDAICAYALYGEEPGEEIPVTAAIAFELTKPNLDTARRKAENGKSGGKSKESGSKQEANGSKPKQTEAKRKQEKEEEQEKEEVKGKEKEQYVIPPTPLTGASPQLQAAFSDWLQYKQERKEGYKPTGLKALETQVLNNAKTYGDQAVADLIRTCMGNNWRGIIFDRLKEQRGGGKRLQGDGPNTSNPFLRYVTGGVDHE